MNIDDPIKIVIVDDTPVITKILAEQITKKYGSLVECITAFSGNEALEILDKIEVDMIICDLEMPVTDGIQVLQQAYQKSPDMLRILLSGYADLENLTSALNECGICSFINKPWQISQLFIIIDSALSKIKLSRENIVLHESNDKSFFELLSLLTDIMNELSPELAEYSRNVASLCVSIAKELKLPDEVIHNIETTAMLHPIGFLGMPSKIFKTHPSQLSGELRTFYQKYPEIGFEMLKATPKLADTREIIRTHQENVDGSGLNALKGNKLRIESRILRICAYYEAAITLRGNSRRATVSQMNRRVNSWFDKRCMQAFLRVITKEIGSLTVPLKIDDLKLGMRLGKNLLSKNGSVLLTSGTTITKLNMKRLMVYNVMNPIEEVFIVVEQ